jgi:hypothetical protein
MFCGRCGVAAKPEDRFCTACGAAAVAPPPPSSPAPPAAVPVVVPEPEPQPAPEPAPLSDGVAELFKGQVRTNCSSFGTTFMPFGAVLYPSERIGDKALQCFEVGDGGDWVAVSQKGWPVVLRDRGESSLSSWTFVSQDAMKLAASWFYEGNLRQGIRAQATRCSLMLTERALRVGLHAKTVIGREPPGPWFLSDDENKVVQLKKHCVYAAVLPYDDITLIDGGRHYIEIHLGGAAGLSMVGGIGRNPKDGKTQWGKMYDFNLALAERMLDWYAKSEDEKKRSAAARVRASDWQSGLANRRGMKCEFKP